MVAAGEKIRVEWCVGRQRQTDRAPRTARSHMYGESLLYARDASGGRRSAGSGPMKRGACDGRCEVNGTEHASGDRYVWRLRRAYAREVAKVAMCRKEKQGRKRLRTYATVIAKCGTKRHNGENRAGDEGGASQAVHGRRKAARPERDERNRERRDGDDGCGRKTRSGIFLLQCCRASSAARHRKMDTFNED